ncbi:MAG: helix-turn-helix domain-containing protein [Eubacteriaceae bacterium]
MNKFKQLRKELGFSQVALAETLGVTQTAVSQWETGKSNPDIEILKKLSKSYHVTIDYLLDATSPSEKIQCSIPIFKEIVNLESFTDPSKILKYESNDDLSNDGYYYGIKLNDDSMHPKYEKNDTIIILRKPSFDCNDDVLVQLNEEKAILRRLVYLEKGTLFQPLNHDFSPIFFSNKEKDAYHILGVAQEIRRSLS